MKFSQTYFNLGKKNKQKTTLYSKSKKKITENIKNRSYGFIDDLFNKNFDEIYQAVKKLNTFNNILFLGTGGTSLGGKTLVCLGFLKIS